MTEYSDQLKNFYKKICLNCPNNCKLNEVKDNVTIITDKNRNYWKCDKIEEEEE